MKRVIAVAIRVWTDYVLETLLTIIAFVFLLIFLKMHAIIVEEQEFQMRLIQDCIAAGASEYDCTAMALDDLGDYMDQLSQP